ncbi:N-acetylneuraminate lyase B-like isoform X2 [Paramacrobiotus metropolitanus]|uniref:N-acetylneuraminate lyase B-like isoform X2 n=1 Tax=Paramacrobiotus metropolitanus TaxID=2943436 RepID=UPI002445969C|nr:N-acetylneuraminate lyase B-like isoform X2 [Paramacrobiotus metropolitanus]
MASVVQTSKEVKSRFRTSQRLQASSCRRTNPYQVDRRGLRFTVLTSTRNLGVDLFSVAIIAQLHAHPLLYSTDNVYLPAFQIPDIKNKASVEHVLANKAEGHCTTTSSFINLNHNRALSSFAQKSRGQTIMSRFNHKGFFVATFTPLKENGDINPDAVPQYVDHLVRNKITGVFVNGTAGEGLSMTVKERKAMAEAWVKNCEGKLKTIIHCGAVCIRDAKEMAEHAQSIGADAIAAVPSFYFPPKTVDALVEGVKEIAAAAPKLPFLYYHIPRMTHVDLDMSAFLQIGKEKIPTLSGMKYSGFDLAGALKCTANHGKEFEIMWGRDDVLLGALAVGLTSFIGSSYSFTAPLALRIVEAFEAGDLQKAKDAQSQLKRTMDATEKYGDQVSAFKAAACMHGLPLGPTRLPLRALDVKEAKAFEDGLKKLGYFDWIKEN